jgi:hypothetical protein
MQSALVLGCSHRTIIARSFYIFSIFISIKTTDKKLLKSIKILWKRENFINKQSQKQCKWINAFVFLFIQLAPRSRGAILNGNRRVISVSGGFWLRADVFGRVESLGGLVQRRIEYLSFPCFMVWIRCFQWLFQIFMGQRMETA